MLQKKESNRVVEVLLLLISQLVSLHICALTMWLFVRAERIDTTERQLDGLDTPIRWIRQRDDVGDLFGPALSNAPQTRPNLCE